VDNYNKFVPVTLSMTLHRNHWHIMASR